MKVRIWIEVYGGNPEDVGLYSSCPSNPPAEATKRYTCEIEIPRNDYATPLHKDNIGSLVEVTADKKGES